MLTSGVLPLVFLLANLAVLQEPAAVDDSFEITPESLAALVAETLPPFERHSGFKFKKAPTVTIGTTEEVEAALSEELRLQLVHLGGDIVADARSAALAPYVLGKYQYKNHRIFINAGAINRMSLIVNMPELRTRDTLAALLMHEYCHAMDHERFQIMTKPHGAKTEEELVVWGYMIEGHAQFVARNVCKKHGLERAFETFTKMIGEVPELPGVDEVTRMIIRTTTDTLVAHYYDGERFFRALHKLGGREAVDRALVKPPASTMELAVPEWYLDPESRANAPDFDQMLSGFGKSFSEEWHSTQVSLTTQQMRGVFAQVEDQKRVSQVLGGVELNRCRVLTFNGGEKLVTAVLVKNRSAVASQAYLSLSEELSRVKDELMATGATRITSARYRDISGEKWRGFVARKVVQVGTQEVLTTVGMAICGNYCIELMYANEPVTNEELIAELESLVASLIAPKAKSK